eukprot:962523-Alexandrium_andersonii.AAC.1
MCIRDSCAAFSSVRCFHVDSESGSSRSVLQTLVVWLNPRGGLSEFQFPGSSERSQNHLEHC